MAGTAQVWVELGESREQGAQLKSLQVFRGDTVGEEEERVPWGWGSGWGSPFIQGHKVEVVPPLHQWIEFLVLFPCGA